MWASALIVFMHCLSIAIFKCLQHHCNKAVMHKEGRHRFKNGVLLWWLLLGAALCWWHCSHELP